jgi:hypothetical protein
VVSLSTAPPPGGPLLAPAEPAHTSTLT